VLEIGEEVGSERSDGRLRRRLENLPAPVKKAGQGTLRLRLRRRLAFLARSDLTNRGCWCSSEQLEWRRSRSNLSTMWLSKPDPVRGCGTAAQRRQEAEMCEG
jgi:hypothetical protein